MLGVKGPDQQGLRCWSRFPRAHTAGSLQPLATPPTPRAKQGGRSACALWQSFLQTPLAPWVQVMGATGALCPLRALHGSQEEYKSLFKERLPWRRP